MQERHQLTACMKRQSRCLRNECNLDIRRREKGGERREKEERSEYHHNRRSISCSQRRRALPSVRCKRSRRNRNDRAPVDCPNICVRISWTCSPSASTNIQQLKIIFYDRAIEINRPYPVLLHQMAHPVFETRLSPLHSTY